MNIIPFNFDGQTIRVVADDGGEPWFHAGDLCSALGYSNPHDAVARHVDSDDLVKREVADSAGRRQQTNHVNESGMYALIFGSALPSAKKFKQWVTREVLPALRRHGAYEVQPRQQQDVVVATKEFKALAGMLRYIGCDKQAAAIGANQAINSLHGVNLLKLTGQTHLEASNQDSVWLTPTQIGKQCQMSAQQINAFLMTSGFQEKVGGQWKPTEAAKELCRIYDTGKKHGDGVPVQQVKWSSNVIQLVQKYKGAA
ncbi:BRO family protein [uncultured Aquabacterium sp.]|uniref:BRO-N domain-containing protein n=1 Tax=uncultured Aquabacterium sp. TaxID=158753 RepID=UPI0025EF78FF|nr:BRO family protein [uncultured Aquabacterium sp.]